MKRPLSMTPEAIRSRRKRERRRGGIRVARVEVGAEQRAWLVAVGWFRDSEDSEDMEAVAEAIAYMIECHALGNFAPPGPAKEFKGSNDLKTNTHKRTIAPPR